MISTLFDQCFYLNDKHRLFNDAWHNKLFEKFTAERNCTYTMLHFLAPG